MTPSSTSALVFANYLPIDSREFCHKLFCYNIAFIVRHFPHSLERLGQIVYSLMPVLINRYQKS